MAPERDGANVSEKRVENVIIVGGACAGYTAAVYTARANLEPLLIEGFQWGGQLPEHDGRGELPRVPRRDHGARADAGLPRAG